jgi:Novel STAND NTPase 1/SIR2-like domain
MTDQLNKPSKPYKYLAHYGLGDQAIFRGREREIRSLYTDVSVSRLVVLFAETGTGKTSLINAGVRPRLEDWHEGERPPAKERQYVTYYVRVGEDPIRSIRAELQELTPVAALSENAPIAPALKQVVKVLQRPIVLFLDQFEEFFLYKDRDRKRRFIDAVANLYADAESGVHIVFSMREEFVGKMDVFREEIPTIFHKDSQLRLGWFDRDQAKEAIALPPKQFGVKMDDDLVEIILKDLLTEDGIEPAQLQIVCSSLWRSRSSSENALTVEHYRKLAEGSDQIRIKGLQAMEDSFAKRVLGWRFESELSGLERKPELDTLAALLPELCSPEETKRIRELSGLAGVSGIDASLLEDVAKYLTKTHLAQMRQRNSVTYIELSHDYLVKRLPALQARVRTLHARRILANGLKAFRENGAELLPEDFGEVYAHAGELEFDSEQARLLLLSALEWDSHALEWFGKAEQAGTDVWALIAEVLESKDSTRSHRAQSALYMLSNQGSQRALDLLEKSLADDDLAPSAIDALINVKTERTVTLLTDLVRQQRCVGEAISTLKILSRTRDETVAEAARTEVERYEAEEKRQDDVRPPMIEPKAPIATSRQSTRGYRIYGETNVSPPYEYLRHLFLKGTVVPFVGAGINVGDRPGIWYDGAPFLPFSSELALHLAETCNFPDQENARDFVRVASYFQETIGRAELRREMRRVIEPAQTPTQIHRYFARIPAPLLILTTNFDDLMERAFQETRKPFDVVTYDFDHHEESEGILWRPQGQPEPIRLPPNQLDVDLGHTSVIFKLAGSYNASRDSLDSYAVTEDDYIEMLTRMLGVPAGVPALFLQHIRSRPFIFMGISLDNWYMRGLFRVLRGPFRESSKSWAILWNPSPYTASLWAQQGVQVCDMRAEEFIERLGTPSIS